MEPDVVGWGVGLAHSHSMSSGTNETKCNFLTLFLCHQVSALTGYEPQDLIEKTLYQYVHSQDMMGVRSMHMTRK